MVRQADTISDLEVETVDARDSCVLINFCFSYPLPIPLSPTHPTPLLLGLSVRSTKCTMDGKTAVAAAAGVVAMTAWVGLRPARSVPRALERCGAGRCIHVLSGRATHRSAPPGTVTSTLRSTLLRRPPSHTRAQPSIHHTRRLS